MQRKKRLKRRTSLKRMKAVIKETQADLSVVMDLGPQDLRDHRDLMDHMHDVMIAGTWLAYWSASRGRSVPTWRRSSTWSIT